MRVVDGAETKAVEGRAGDVRVGAPTHPISESFGDVRAAGAVLEFLRSTSVGCIAMEKIPPEDRGGHTEGKEDGPLPP